MKTKTWLGIVLGICLASSVIAAVEDCDYYNGLEVVVQKAPRVVTNAVQTVVIKSTYIRDSSLIGEYDQPEWTEHRRFPTTRCYLQQEPGEIGVEQWIRSEFNKGERATHRVQSEAEIGLPGRMQADFYINSEIEKTGTYYYDNFAMELRYALADWGVIPLNPTLYGEYKIKDTDRGADVGEVKVLIGDQFGNGWAWAYNLAYEWDLWGDEQAEELGHCFGLSKTIIDRKLSLGVEGRYTSETVKGERDNPEKCLNVGPSIQWRPVINSHIDLCPLIGVTKNAPDLMTYLVIGYDFGGATHTSKSVSPIGARSN